MLEDVIAASGQKVEIRPELTGIDPAELSDYLLKLGISAKTYLTDGGLAVEADVELKDALDAFVPTSTLDKSVIPYRSNYVPADPARDRLRAFRDAVRAGTDDKIELAEVRSLLADLIDQR